MAVAFVRALGAGACIVAHAAGALLLIVAIYAAQSGLMRTGDPKLFDWVSLCYVFDARDAGILVAFITLGTIGAIDVFRGDRDR